jgi:hypothetical protein
LQSVAAAGSDTGGRTDSVALTLVHGQSVDWRNAA